MRGKGGGGRYLRPMSRGEGVPCHVTYPMMHFMLPTPPPVNTQMPVKTLPSYTSFASGNYAAVGISEVVLL